MSGSEASESSSASSAAASRPRPRGVALVIAVAFAHGLWALFQWTQLVAARTGGSSFCGLSESTACVEIWDSGFASAIQGWSGVPIAGWGLIWSLAAFGLPLWTLAESARQEPPAEAGIGGSAWAATLWMAIGGLAGIVVLFSVSVLEGHLCTTCVVTYTIVAVYALACFVQTPIRTVPLAKGVSLASGALGLSFVLLFIPGLRTPLSESEAGRQVLEQLAQDRPPLAEPAAPAAPATTATSEEPREGHSSVVSVDTGDPATAGVAELLAGLPDRLEQAFSNELDRYKRAPHVPIRPARALVGPENAPVRITEFTDALCGHCASLHETIAQLSQALPDGSFALEARHFPLDSACNPLMEGESKTAVRCLAARSAICLEDRPEAFVYAGRIYENQRTLDDDKVYELAEPLLTKNDLVSCVNAPDTEAKLQDDIAWAMEHDIQGTPLVLLNGRPVAAFGPLIYALILTRGDAEHEVFSVLPEPEPDSGDPHAGHAH